MTYSNLPDKIAEAVEYANQALAKQSVLIDKTSEINHRKVLNAFQEAGISTYHLTGTTGYGLGDTGRESLDEIIAKIMGTESGMLRHQFISGTHAIASVLYGLLRPGDHFVSVSGMPYDTLQQVIGIKQKHSGSLLDLGVTYDILPLAEDGSIQTDMIDSLVKPQTRLFILQRSRGYEWRNSLDIKEMERFIKIVKAKYPQIDIFIDNCYGELVEEKEPGDIGADIMAGSLIKNLGGTLAPTGGYIAGREDLVEKAANRFAAPGIGRGIGATLDNLRLLYQGLFFSPLTVSEALKGAVFSAAFWQKLGFEVHPQPEDHRTDIIQAIKLNSRDRMIAFCQGLQKGSPIDSHVLAVPSEMPGYEDEVIMAEIGRAHV